MRDVISKFSWGVIAVYFIISQFFAVYFMYDYTKTHDFIDTILAGAFISEYKAIFFPFFI